MSIRTHSKCSRRHGHSPRARGFTLIELLVVVSIIAVLMSILLPSLKAARESARAVVCGQKLRDLATGLQTYFTEENEWIPGVNTSGVAIRAANDGSSYKRVFYNNKAPVQSYDWITPHLAKTTEMPSLRVDRFREVIERFACPSQGFYKAVVYSGGFASSIDSNDWLDDLIEERKWTALSYLMPVHFQEWGYRHNETVVGYTLTDNEAIKATVINSSWEAAHPTYKSKLGLVGTPSRKIAAADGTRYLTEDLLLDFDPNPEPGSFGSFTSSGAWWAGSTAYGVKSGTPNWSGGRANTGGHSPARGAQLELSYRHGVRRGSPSGSALDNKCSINAMFFDGSVRRLNDQQSRDPVLWYPRGTVVNTPQEGMIRVVERGDKIP